MRSLWETRHGGSVVMVALLTVTAGCSALGGGGCGPGDTEIADVEASGDEVTVKGKVASSRMGAYAIDDGSGIAFVMDRDSSVSQGDCVTVTGQAQDVPDLSDMGYGDIPQPDISIRASGSN